jgi:hypothetical protein
VSEHAKERYREDEEKEEKRIKTIRQNSFSVYNGNGEAGIAQSV